MHSIDETTEEKSSSKRISLDTTIREFIKIVGHKDVNGKPKGLKLLPLGIYIQLYEIGGYVDTLGDLKKLAEVADGFSRLKDGVYFNDGKCLPYRALTRLGKGKLAYINSILSEYDIEPIPWTTRKFSAWERKKEKGDFWHENLKI